MLCAIDVQHEDTPCLITYRVYTTDTLTTEIVHANVTSCSYRGPYVETAHLHGNGTLSVQMATRSAISSDSVRDYKFTLSCDGEEAVLASEPEVLLQGRYFASQPVPASFASVNYWGVHAFGFVDATGKRQFGKWIFEPVGADAAVMPVGCCEKALRRRSGNSSKPS